MKKLFLAATLTVLSNLSLAQTAPATTDLPIQIYWQQSSRTPMVVQNFVNKLFKEKCKGAIQWANKQNDGLANVTFEDNYSGDTRTNYQATYVINYDFVFNGDLDMNATFNVNYTVVRKNNKIQSVKITAADVADAYDSSHCDVGRLSKTELAKLIYKK